MYKEIEYLKEDDLREVLKLLAMIKNNPLQVADMWFLMDYVWDQIGCDNKNINMEKLDEFYNHPVWYLNGIFIENSSSLKTRQTINQYIVKQNFKSIVDYGGGWGTLARIIASNLPLNHIVLYEKFPNKYLASLNKKYNNLIVKTELDGLFDCLVSMDVLEHVTEPLKILAEMIDSIKLNGKLILANNFTPVIKCHLPNTFHLRFTFDFFAYLMGIKRLYRINDSHAIVYEKKMKKKYNWRLLNSLELICQKYYPLLVRISPIAIKMKGIFFGARYK